METYHIIIDEYQHKALIEALSGNKPNTDHIADPNTKFGVDNLLHMLIEIRDQNENKPIHGLCL